MDARVLGIHHITAIAGDPQENLDFYSGVLGMRLVKRSVNQDAPDTYHFFFADGEGHPGTDLTFFPWPKMRRGRMGNGKASEISLAVPSGSLDYWSGRLKNGGISLGDPELRRGRATLPFTDPHGLPLALVETSDPRDFTPWESGPVPADKQVRGLHSLRLNVLNIEPTDHFLTHFLGFERDGEEEGWHAYKVGSGGSGNYVEIRETPEAPAGDWGVGSMHHVAWRVADVDSELAVRARVASAGRRPTEVIDRFWFKSVYFQEPGGVLFELATDGPGFAADEEPERLGETLVLPPWLEQHRGEIEAGLPPIQPYNRFNDAHAVTPSG